MRLKLAFILSLIAVVAAQHIYPHEGENFPFFYGLDTGEQLFQTADSSHVADIHTPPKPPHATTPVDLSPPTPPSSTSEPASETSSRHRAVVQDQYHLWHSVAGLNALISNLKRKLRVQVSEQKKRVSSADHEKIRLAKEKMELLKKKCDSIFSETEEQHAGMLQLADEIDVILEELVVKHQVAVEEAEEEIARTQEAITKEQSAIDDVERNLVKRLTRLEELKGDLRGDPDFSFADDSGTQSARTHYPVRADYMLRYTDPQIAIDFVRRFKDAYPTVTPGEEEHYFEDEEDEPKSWWLYRSVDMGEGRKLRIDVALLRELEKEVTY